MQTYKPTSDIKTNEPMFKKSCICYWRYIRVILGEIGQHNGYKCSKRFETFTKMVA